MTNYIGDTIEQYHIIEQLGHGGMANVYRAYDTRLERDVAVKVVRKESIPPEQLERILKRFEREAKSLAKFIHPNIVPVHDYGEYQGAPYLVMAYLPGGTLKDSIGEPMPFQQALDCVIPVADALAYAHKRGVIHRDVKPSNVLITEEGVKMLSDFGIARLIEESTTQLTATGMGVGTPEYMAPEQWNGQATEASDQYSLGIVLFELLTGRKPFTAETPFAVALKAMNEPLPRPCELVSGIPRQVENVFFKALARDPQNRYVSMKEFHQALKRIQLVDVETVAEKMVESETFDQLALPKQEFAEVVEKNNVPNSQTKISSGISVPAVKKDGYSVSSLVTKTSPVNVQKKKKFPAWGLYIALGLVLVSIVIGIGNRLWNLAEEETGALAVLATKTQTAMETITATITITQTATITKTSTPTTTFTPTPTLGIDSTMIREKDGMEMVFVPAGEFTMGSENGGIDEQPVHKVYLDEFWIDKYEITNAQYASCVEDGICSDPYAANSRTRTNYYGTDEYSDYPVIFVNWSQALSYCQWVGGYLPTDAQWEKAARGTEKYTYPWGNTNPTCDLVNFKYCVGDTNIVGAQPSGASPYGAMDMAGNVWEWVADWYDPYYYYNSQDQNPLGPNEGSIRGLRGGCWDNVYNIIRAAVRHWSKPTDSWSHVGFRCAFSEP